MANEQERKPEPQDFIFTDGLGYNLTQLSEFNNLAFQAYFVDMSTTAQAYEDLTIPVQLT
ncbi:hypothetical protein BC938DRAFT_478092 [Jimgerdemannia flammicorona]|uniref:Uncharacterized protein n=1 Tax=Jimgerdemannia flammicorona TaxID=994334 RepID=A0A433QNG6_9FUNG|nr:hypothetical protein BC938DRAFT_478092 [Jimgerdemannia flammicorona]